VLQIAASIFTHRAPFSFFFHFNDHVAAPKRYRDNDERLVPARSECVSPFSPQKYKTVVGGSAQNTHCKVVENNQQKDD
jgi:hypothetical protein